MLQKDKEFILFLYEYNFCFDFSTIFAIIQQEKRRNKLTETKKKRIILLSAIALLLASIVVLVIYFCMFRPKTQSSDVFTISCPNLEMTVGQTSSLPIEMSYEDAELSFQIDDGSIAVISDGSITALKAGVTKVRVDASYQNKQASCSFSVSVSRQSFSCRLTENADCKIFNDQIFLTSSSCQFSLQLYDEFDNLILNPLVEASVSDNENMMIEKLPFGFLLSASKDGFVTFNFYQLDFSITFEVIAL